MKYFLILILSFFLISCDQGINPNNNNTHGVIGLNNETGHYCYLNAVIQALSNLSPKSNFLENANLSAPEKIMKNILIEYKNIQKTGQYSQAMTNYKNQLLDSIFNQANRNRQNCSVEVLSQLSDYTKPKEIIINLNSNLNNLKYDDLYFNQELNHSQLLTGNLYIIQLNRQTFNLDNSKDITPMPIAREITRYGNRYRLSAVIIHIGQSTNHGHYTTLLIKGNESFHCDDANISDGSKMLNEIVSTGNTGDNLATPYVLFYEKE